MLFKLLLMCAIAVMDGAYIRLTVYFIGIQKLVLWLRSPKEMQNSTIVCGVAEIFVLFPVNTVIFFSCLFYFDFSLFRLEESGLFTIVYID